MSPGPFGSVSGYINSVKCVFATGCPKWTRNTRKKMGFVSASFPDRKERKRELMREFIKA